MIVVLTVRMKSSQNMRVGLKFVRNLLKQRV